MSALPPFVFVTLVFVFRVILVFAVCTFYSLMPVLYFTRGTSQRPPDCCNDVFFVSMLFRLGVPAASKPSGVSTQTPVLCVLLDPTVLVSSLYYFPLPVSALLAVSARCAVADVVPLCRVLFVLCFMLSTFTTNV